MEGGCLCGNVRYTAEISNFNGSHCHCRICQKSSGAGVLSWISVKRDKVIVSANGNENSLTCFASSELAQRHFCNKCGTQLFFMRNDEPEEMDITIASFDNPDEFQIKSHLFTSSRREWIENYPNKGSLEFLEHRESDEK